jgi:hypothetical protein
LAGQQLQPKAAIGLLALGIGIVLIILSIIEMVTHYGLPLHPVILGVVGVLLLALGLFLFLTSFFEVLSRSQTALVDGLHAG